MRPRSSSSSHLHTRPLTIKLAWIVALVGFAFYANSITNGYTLDDLSAILENRYVQQGMRGIPWIITTSYRHGSLTSQDELYRPLSTSMFALEWQFFPRNPQANHVVGVAFYALTGLLLVLLLDRLFEGNEPTLAFVASLLFICHPLHTDLVSGIKGRDEIMCFFFAVVALYCTTRYVGSGAELWLLLTVAAYFLSLLSKESSITLVGIVPVMIWFFRSSATKRNLIASGAFVGTALVYLLIRSQVLPGGVTGHKYISLLDNPLAHAPDLFSRLSSAMWVLGQYLRILVLPYPLVCDYSYATTKLVAWTDPRVWIAVACYLGLVVWIVRELPRKTVIAFGLLFYLISITVVSNVVVLIGAAMAERFLYFPSLGFAIVLAGLLVRVSGSNNQLRATRVTDLMNSNVRLFYIVLPILFVYAFTTVKRNADWKDNYTLYSRDVSKQPANARLHYLLGSAIVNERMPGEEESKKLHAYRDQAISELQEATRIYPSFGDAYAQLGVAYYRSGDRQKAIDYYTESLRHEGYRAPVYSHLGVCYYELGRRREAIEMFLKAVKSDPTYVDAFVNLGVAFGLQGDWEHAIAWYERALALQPNDPALLSSLAAAYAERGESNPAPQ